VLDAWPLQQPRRVYGLPAVQDWTSLPLSLLGDIFTRLLEHTGSLDATVRLWQGLALVCKSWLLALRESTPLCLELTKPEHLSATARSWLSRVPLEVCGPHLPVHAAASFCCLRFAAACCAHTLQLLVALLCPPNQAFTGCPWPVPLPDPDPYLKPCAGAGAGTNHGAAARCRLPAAGG
jgi:hypothetical protein